MKTKALEAFDCKTWKDFIDSCSGQEKKILLVIGNKTLKAEIIYERLYIRQKPLLAALNNMKRLGVLLSPSKGHFCVAEKTLGEYIVLAYGEDRKFLPEKYEIRKMLFSEITSSLTAATRPLVCQGALQEDFNKLFIEEIKEGAWSSLERMLNLSEDS